MLKLFLLWWLCGTFSLLSWKKDIKGYITLGGLVISILLGISGLGIPMMRIINFFLMYIYENLPDSWKDYFEQPLF